MSPLEGIKKRFKNAKIIHTMGYSSGPSVYDEVIPTKLNQDSLYVKAIKIAKKADVVLFIGGLNKNHLQDCEGDDREIFQLPYQQEKLINGMYEVNKNIGFLLLTGNAVEMSWLPKTKGVLQTWYLGSMAGEAIAQIISGDKNPSGKLPFSFPKKLKDNAAHFYGETSYPGVNMTQHYKEDILVGYRWFDTKKIAPQYAFGYGLSYTNFKFSDIKTDKNVYSLTDKITVHCTVTNNGNRQGAEVIQVYIGKLNSDVKRASKELKGFKKVFLKSYKKETAKIEINVSDLAFYNEKISDWAVEKGTYSIYVGNASDSISETIKVTIK
ncbi:glycoside hydrolase family 3 C-terminal domain-containing protein [Polaribacter sp. Hel1_33_96]|uniref:glycoside hydrolase family 3 C-terminal domain-containing protein n=1 Tax=Polaribacter sp. Hel1_33_96 TaxID=1336805 RepID=UPI0034A0CB82